MTLRISEKWIRERVGLTHDVIEDVRSLALPGTYHEKIGSLGRSLLGFTRLKTLDLSRNALANLEGLENLKALDTLNLYYNNIPDLSELFRLRHNLNLQDLDLRLNPVVKNEPDYRLFCIHLLPGLKHLDDRPVRVAEKRAALMQFSMDQEETDGEKVNQKKQRSNVQLVSRRKLVASFASRPTALPEDDCALIDLISHEDLPVAKELTGSMANEPAASLHSPSDEEAGEQLCEETGERIKQSRPPPFLPSAEPAGTLPGGQVRLRHAHLGRQDKRQPADPNLIFSDEAEAYASFSTHAHFTANPRAKQQELEQLNSLSSGNDRMQEGETESDEVEELSSGDEALPEIHINGEIIDRATQQLLVLTRQRTQKSLELQDVRKILLGLVHVTVRDQIESESLCRQQLDEMTQTAKMLNVQLGDQRRLTEKLKRRIQKESQVEEVLVQAEKEAASLRLHVQRLEDEKVALVDEISGLKIGRRDTIIVPADIRDKLDKLEMENAKLGKDVEKYYAEREQSRLDREKVDGLIAMLQESHRTLIATNSRLVRETDEARRRHQHEVEQLHWSYEQLKRTLNTSRSSLK